MNDWLVILERIIAKMLGGIPLSPDEQEWLDLWPGRHGC